MALPVLSSPEFITEIPSTKEKIKFRPFLVREEKILYMALEGGDPKEIQNATIKVLNDCILTPNVDASKLATFDVEYLFLQLRGKSVGESVDVVLRHTDSECKETVNVSISLDDIKVVQHKHNYRKSVESSTKTYIKHPFSIGMKKEYWWGINPEYSKNFTFISKE